MFDINAKLGHWPYRPVKGIDGLLRDMDAYGVAQAAVSSLNAAHYLNPQDGNEEVAAAVAPYRDRLIPLAVLRPNFTAWEEDVTRCLDEFGMKGLVLYPGYHRFSLAAPVAGRLAETAAARNVPVLIQTAMEDPRRQYDRPVVPETPASEIGAYALAYPALTVIALGLKFGQPEQAGAPLPPNLYFDTSNYETSGELAHAVGAFGPDKILFGSNFPLFNLLANVLKIERADLEPEHRSAIAEQNAKRLLGL